MQSLIVGDSMWPRFRPGRRVAVSAEDARRDRRRRPGEAQRSSPAGAGGGAVSALIKELVRRSGSGVELRQFNPDVTFKVEAADIAAIEKVLGESGLLCGLPGSLKRGGYRRGAPSPANLSTLTRAAE